MNSVIFLCLFTFLFKAAPSWAQLDEFTYAGFNDPNSNISLSGEAEIRKNGVLQLTNGSRGVMGHAFYPKSFQFKNFSSTAAFSFSTSFAFAIVPEYESLGGHGFAFAITPFRDLNSGVARQYLGLLNSSDMGNFSNHLFAVEFDTVLDLEFNDINGNHVGIDINSLVSNKSAPAGYFDDNLVKHDLNLQSGEVMFAWIEYDSATNTTNVTLSLSSSKPKSPVLSFQLDLSPIFEKNMYVGFSASTGLLASSHYLLGWSFKLNGEAQNLDFDSLASLPTTKKKNRALTVSLSVLAFVLALTSIFVAVYLVKKVKNADVIEDWELEIGPHRYPYRELKKATRGFKESEVLGFGGFGKVYKGTLPNSKVQVAVKRISNESKQGIREFVSEISTIGRLRHRNIVQLLGWCRRYSDLLLVYDFMPNGSLDRFLFDRPKFILSWEQRFKIIKGVASGLLYLHEGYEQIVVHRDVKASNVLLDAELNGRLGDFGLARLYDHGANPSTTKVVGTLGYLAPELPRTGRATTSTDVYAFGALLLEVVCGRRPVEAKAAPEELVLVDWVWDKWRAGKVLEVVDRRLKGEFDKREVLMVLKLGLMCSSNAPSARPKMRQIVSYLEGEVATPDSIIIQDINDGELGGEKGFDAYLHSYASSSFEKTTSSFTQTPKLDADLSLVSISTPPVSLLQTSGDSRW